MHEPTRQANDAAIASPALSLRDVRFTWPRAQKPIIAIERLDIARAERVFLRGPSGSGKSTLLALIGGVVQPQTGLLRVLDHDLTTLKGAARDRFRADNVGFVFQQFNLLPYLGVVDNVLLAARFSRRRRRLLGGSAESQARRGLAALGLTDGTLLAPPSPS